MPFRLNEHRTTIKIITFAQMPSLIYRACLATGTVSNTRYIQEAICEKLARDGIEPVESLKAKLPPSRTNAATLFDGSRKAVGGKNYVASKNIEEVK
jgi:hypothetical protein